MSFELAVSGAAFSSGTPVPRLPTSLGAPSSTGSQNGWNKNLGLRKNCNRGVLHDGICRGPCMVATCVDRHGSDTSYDPRITNGPRARHCGEYESGSRSGEYGADPSNFRAYSLRNS